MKHDSCLFSVLLRSQQPATVVNLSAEHATMPDHNPTELREETLLFMRNAQQRGEGRASKHPGSEKYLEKNICIFLHDFLQKRKRKNFARSADLASVLTSFFSKTCVEKRGFPFNWEPPMLLCVKSPAPCYAPDLYAHRMLITYPNQQSDCSFCSSWFAAA